MTLRDERQSVDGSRSDQRRGVPGLHGIWSNRREVSAIWRGGRMDTALREKIMVAGAEVNGCRFCSFAVGSSTNL